MEKALDGIRTLFRSICFWATVCHGLIVPSQKFLLGVSTFSQSFILQIMSTCRWGKHKLMSLFDLAHMVYSNFSNCVTWEGKEIWDMTSCISYPVRPNRSNFLRAPILCINRHGRYFRFSVSLPYRDAGRVLSRPP